MALESVTAALGPPAGRSRFTNNIRRTPDGVHGKSARGRRYLDVLDGLILEFGLGDADRLRELATLRLSLEATQAAVVAGDILRSEDLVRLANLISRREKELRARRRQASAQPPAGLRDKLSSRYKGDAP